MAPGDTLVDPAVTPRPEDGLALHSTPGRLALAATVGASAMASLDATVVNVALPRIGAELDAGVSGLQWVLTGYLLPLAALILLGGALSDRWGRRRVFVIGTVWFAGASLLCGLAPSIEILVAARILQGIGGALVTPGSLAIIQASFRQNDRAPAVGAWSGLGGVAGAIGPFVGGAVIGGPGWRWAFLLNVPVAAGVIVCTKAAVPETKDVEAGDHLDVLGAVYVSVGLAAATWALTAAQDRGWRDPAVLGVIAVAVVAVAAFVRRIRHVEDPLVPPALFGNRTFTVVNIGTLSLYAAIGLVFFVVAYQLQVVAQWSALEAGIALLPTTLLMLVLSAQSGKLAQRLGPRLQLGVGPLVTAAGFLLLARVGEDPAWITDVLPGAVVLGIGLVTFVAPLTATVMDAAGAAHVSVASGINNAVARSASLLGLAVIPVVSGLTSATNAAALTDAYRIALFIAAGLAAIAGPAMFFGLTTRARAEASLRPIHCAVEGPPVQPNPLLCRSH